MVYIKKIKYSSASVNLNKLGAFYQIVIWCLTRHKLESHSKQNSDYWPVYIELTWIKENAKVTRIQFKFHSFIINQENKKIWPMLMRS